MGRRGNPVPINQRNPKDFHLNASLNYSTTSILSRPNTS